MDTSLFYAERYVSNKYYESLKKMCNRCPVRQNCLQQACFIRNEEWGLWAGFTLSQRQQIKRDAKFCGLNWQNLDHVKLFIKAYEPRRGYFQPTLIESLNKDGEE